MARGYNGSTSNYHLGTAAPLGRYPAALIGRYKKSSDVTTEQCMMSIGVTTGGTAKSILVEVNAGTIIAVAGDGVSFDAASKSGAAADSQWHSFYAGFRDLTYRIAGHDGVFGTANTNSRDWLNGSPTMNRVVIGGLYWSPTNGMVNPFNGELAECAFLQTLLSEEEFLAWHNGTHGGRAYTLQDMRPGTCRAYYPLNDGTGNEANYCSKYANTNYDLTEQGTVTQTTHPTVATFAPDGMWRPLISNQRVWTNGVSETIFAGAHTWPGIVQHSYSTKQSVSDNFDRGVDGTLGSNWSNVISSHSIANNTAEPSTLDAEAVSRWVGSFVTGADQFAEISESGMSGGATSSQMGPVVRCDATGQNMYWVWAPFNGNLTLYKRVAGVDTSLGTFAHAFVALKKLYLEAVGTTIRVLIDGVQRISVTDSAVTSGLPGLRTYHGGGDGLQVASWRGGTIGSSAAFYPQDYEAYLDTLQSYGHNYTRAWGWDFMRAPVFSPDSYNYPLPYGRSGTSGAYDGGNKFDLTTLDSNYFTRLVAFVAAARTRNIVCSVVLWEMSLGGSLTAGHPFTSTNNVNSITGESGGNMAPVYTLATAAITTAQDLYLDAVLAALGSYSNVQYELGNEPFAGTTNTNGTTSGCDAWQDRMREHIHVYEFANCRFQHMIVACGSNELTVQSRSADALQSRTTWTSYTGTPTWTVPEYGPTMLIYDADHHNDNSALFTSGVFWRAACQGNCGLLNMEDGYFFGEPASGAWYGVRPAIRNNLGYILSMTRRTQLATARPSSALSSTGFCLATPGHAYLVYQASATAFTVDLSSRAVPFAVEWLNTDTGVRTRTTVTGGSAAQSFTPPFAGSTGVVLLLTADLEQRMPNPACT